MKNRRTPTAPDPITRAIDAIMPRWREAMHHAHAALVDLSPAEAMAALPLPTGPDPEVVRERLAKGVAEITALADEIRADFAARRAEAAEWELRARMAHESGRDDLAAQAIARVDEHLAEARALEPERRLIEGALERWRAALDAHGGPPPPPPDVPA